MTSKLTPEKRATSFATHRDHALAHAREKLAPPKRERKPFAERLDRACKKDRQLARLVLGTEPATTPARVLLLTRCAHWCFTTEETATLLEALDERV